MSPRRKAPRDGAEIYGLTLFPTLPSDGFGRFMCLNLRNRLGRELWLSRETARTAVIADLGTAWPVRHWCVIFWHADSFRDREESPHDVLCLACMWLGQTWSPQSAFLSAQQHALEEMRPQDSRSDVVRSLEFRAWQRGDAEPCWFSPDPNRHHAHSIRAALGGADSAECLSCDWTAGPFHLRKDADRAAYQHMEDVDGPPRIGRDGYHARGERCPRPFPPPARILRADS